MVNLINSKLFLILFSSILTGLAQHFSILGFITWFSLTPFILVLMQIDSYKEVVKYSFIWGFFYNLISVYWIATNIGTVFFIGCISMILTVFVLSVNSILVSLIWIKIKKYFSFNSLYFLPFVWISIDYLRTYGSLGFPWINLANTQTNYFFLIQNAEIFGIYGITFWIILINCLFVALFYNKIKSHLIIVVLLFPFLSGFVLYSRLDINKDESIKASLVQPNVTLFNKSQPNYAKKNLDYLIEKTNFSILDGSNLIIWPESAVPFYNLQDPVTLDYLSKKLFNNNDVSLLSGDITYVNNQIFNSSVLLNKDGISEIYHKQRLVPMGEYVPLSNIFTSLRNINFGQTNFSIGIDDVLFEVNDKKFSSLICFESTFPEINRRHADMGADFFVYLVNDGWYTSIPEPRQHAKQSIFRAIENRKSVLRCANTGITMVVSPSGEVEQQTKLNTQDVITTFISKANTITFYTKFGNIFVYLMLTITMLLFAYSLYKNENNN